MTGIDVSHDQETLDWMTVAANGPSFAFAKSTEGTGFVDPKFNENWLGMKAAGIFRGAYHFFHPSMDSATQAAHFISTLSSANGGSATLNPGDLPPVVDLEWTKDTPLPPEEYVVAIQTFLDAVQTATGRVPAIYTNASFWNPATGSSTAFGKYPLWVAEYGVSAPKLPSGWTQYAFWQSSESGHVPGISTAVDMDSFNGTLAELQALTGGAQ